MRFIDFATYLEKLENTSKRLEITSILSELIAKLDQIEIDKAIYMSLGTLDAVFRTPKFNLAEKSMLKAIEHCTKKDPTDTYNRLGDLGDTVLHLLPTDKTSKLTIINVHDKLTTLASITGTGSQDKKLHVLSSLLSELDPLSSKYVVRIILGTTRLGFTELTIIDALTEFLGKSKEIKNEIEDRYNQHPDIGLIAKSIKERGLKGISNLKADTGTPILPQKAQRAGGVAEIFERLPNSWAEFKFDGTRVQLHMDKNKKSNQPNDLFQNSACLVKTYTRNLEDVSYQFPDLIASVLKNIKAESIIIDGEAIAFDKKTNEFLPFQEVMQRKRKHNVKEFSEDIPLKLFVFDILYLNGNNLMDKSLEERSTLLERIITKNDIVIKADHAEIHTQKDLSKYYETAKKLNLEGLIIKDPKGKYQAGARSYAWIKLKKADEKLVSDSLDLVILGYYFGKGDRNKFGIGGFLAGIYDKSDNTFKTTTKVGTGLTDEDFEYLKKEADKNMITKIPQNVLIPDIYKPDVILTPKLMVEIGSDEITVSKNHSAGLALRFPRLLFFRTDKSPTDCTTLEELTQMYKSQLRGKL